jgi:hypothetical protein
MQIKNSFAIDSKNGAACGQIGNISQIIRSFAW